MRLPTFLVIGAAKAGTTSLHFYLRQHPDVYLTPVKETNFYWAEGRALGRSIVRTTTEYARLFEGAGAARAIGEISPQYLNSPTAAGRIAADLPDVRLVVSLRNPAERAYSDYLGRVRIGRESRDLAAAVRPGERIFEDGLYYPRLQRFFERFPRDRVHVMLYEDFARRPRDILRDLFTFIGVDPDAPVDTSTRHNQAAAPRSRVVNRVLWAAMPFARRLVPPRWRGSGLAEAFLRKTCRPAPPCPPAVRRSLRDRYRTDVLATAALIDRDLAGWLDD